MKSQLSVRSNASITADAFDFSGIKFPTTGLVLVFGGVGSGKDCGVLQPVLNALAEAGRPTMMIDHDFKQRLVLPKIVNPKPNAHSAIVVNEAQLLFAASSNQAPENDQRARDQIIREITQTRESQALIVLSFQSINVIGPEYTKLLLGHACAEIFLHCSDGGTNEYARGREIVRFGGLLRRPIPLPITLRVNHSQGKPNTQAIICTRAKPNATWHCRLATLPLISARPQEPNTNAEIRSVHSARSLPIGGSAQDVS